MADRQSLFLKFTGLRLAENAAMRPGRACRPLIPTKGHSITVGYVSTLAFQIHPPPPPRMEAVEWYLSKIPREAALQYPELEPRAAMFAYKKAAKKVHLVAASLPEDFRIVRR